MTELPVHPLSEEELAALPIFPLPAGVLFPGAVLPLHVFEPRYRELVRDALAGSKALAVARLRPGYEAGYQGRPPVFDICGAGRIVEHVEHPDGRFHMMLRGVSRVRIVEELPPDRSYRVVRAEVLRDLAFDAALSSALATKIAALWRVLAPELPEPMRDLAELTRGADEISAYSDRIAATVIGDPDLGQSLLAELDPCERLRLLAEQLQNAADAVAPRASKGRSQLN
ncbi:MAG TPA: LON peptidase substrate-binding domain-containing protein [Polyangiaceae bacterium]